MDKKEDTTSIRNREITWKLKLRT